MRAPPITSLNRKCFAFATRLSLCAKRCFDPQPLHASQRFVLRTDYVIVHSASSILKREHRRARCGWDVKIKEQWRIKDCNLQSGAVLATLALRALFLGILPPLPCGGGKGVGCHVERSETSLCLESRKILLICHCERAQRASVAINRQRIPIRLIATRLTPLAMTRDNDVSGIQHV